MSTNAQMALNDADKPNDLTLKHMKRLYKPSLLKDPKSLFDEYSITSIPFFKADFSNDQQLTWLIPAVADLERIKKERSVTIWNVGYFIGLVLCVGISGYLGVVLCLDYQSFSRSWMSTIAVMCLYAGALIGLGRISTRNWSRK